MSKAEAKKFAKKHWKKAAVVTAAVIITVVVIVVLKSRSTCLLKRGDIITKGGRRGVWQVTKAMYGYCCTGCKGPIEAGDLYMRSVAKNGWAGKGTWHLKCL